MLDPADSSATFSSMPKLNEDSLRFSPTSLFSEDSVSLRDFQGGNAVYSYSGMGKMQAEMSTLSSVSSITLQDDLSIDTVSLPEDPFPNGLPSFSSASSTIGSPVSSRSTFSNSSVEGVGEKLHRDCAEEEQDEACDNHQQEKVQFLTRTKV